MAENDEGRPLDARGADLGALAKQLREQIPEVYEGRDVTHKAAMADGALDRKTKELIALACAVVEHCDGCIDFHARATARAGATPEEVAEAIGVTILMEGGPATVYGPRAYGEFLRHHQPQGE